MTSRIFGSTPAALSRVSSTVPTNSRQGVAADRRLNGYADAPAPSTRDVARGDSDTARETQNLRQQSSPAPLVK
jgi:hypothetical protein